MDDAALMALALAEAEHALTEGELPIAALVALAGEPIAVERTRERATGRLLVHAELVALERADANAQVRGRRRELTLVTTLEPCPMCLGAALAARVGRVVYALASPTDGAHALFASWEPSAPGFDGAVLPEIVGGLAADESRALVAAFVATDTSARGAWAATLLD